jgi:putative sigma-54 modulation protein
VKVVIHDRTERAGASLRSYAERKLDRLSRHFDRVLEAEVHFDEETRRSSVPVVTSRILVHAAGRKAPVLQAQDRAADERAALDLALDKIDRQVLKLKERRRDRRAPSANGADPEPPAAPTLDVVRRHLKPETVERAQDALESGDLQFHLFLNEDSGEINVIYRRADGGLRVIEPILR